MDAKQAVLEGTRKISMKGAKSLAALSARSLAEEAREAFANPSLTPFYVVTAAAVGAAIWLFTARKREEAIFVGLWVPTLLALSALNKLARHERE
ncbi:MAG TPA: hypothetical protein VKV28_13115 [Candidatus Binataceae bacterium]|nr:hypothetical protein [Candidatus Binataceae bacterium]